MGADSVDEAVRARKKMEPGWDDLREQRVLGRIAAARRERATEAERSRGSEARAARRRRIVVPVVAVAAAAALVIAWLGVREETATIATNDTNDTNGAAGQGAAGEGATPSGDPARLELADGSVAFLSRDARVSVARQSEREVVIAQEAGEVTYDVAHAPERAFVVRARHATVTVRGTRFTVAIDGAFVGVDVEEGRVEVRAGEEATLLTAGERIRVGPPEVAPEAVRDEEAGDEEARSPSRPQGSSGGDAREPVVRRERARAERTAETAEAPSLEALQRAADEARRRGDVDEAARILRAAIEAHDGDPRAPGALFTLGRLERRRGGHAEAARAFERARSLAPTGPLAEDALAEAAVSWHEAGDVVRAAAAARRYLALHPDGLHAPRMRPLVP